MILHSHIIPAKSQKNNCPPLIMMHGWGRSLEDLKPLGQILAEHTTVHLLDLPGFGQTEAPPESGWDTSQYMQVVCDYLDQHTIKQVILIGHSFGGRIALRITAAQPERVKKLVLISSHGLRPIRSTYQNFRIWLIKKLAKLIKVIDRNFGTNLLMQQYAKRFGSLDYQRAGVLKNTFVKTVSEDQHKSAATIKTPTLLLWGSLDQETPVAMGQRFNQLMSGSRLIVMEGKDHNPYQGVGSHLCAHYISEFILTSAYYS